MSLRMRVSLCAASGLVFVLAFGSPARADDLATVKQLQETVTKLEKKVADLEKQAKAYPGAKPDKNDEEYVKQKGGAIIDAFLAGDTSAVHGTMTVKLLKGINNFWQVGSLNHNVAVDEWIGKCNANKQYKSYEIDKVVFSPSRDEAVFSGSLKGKDAAVKGTFTMTLIKEKDKYLLDGFTLKEK